jgi:hypothetical protein
METMEPVMIIKRMSIAFFMVAGLKILIELNYICMLTFCADSSLRIKNPPSAWDKACREATPWRGLYKTIIDRRRYMPWHVPTSCLIPLTLPG